MKSKKNQKRAYIGDDEERQIIQYSLSPLYRDRKLIKLAEKIQTTVTWPGKKPELEVLEKKITKYRNTDVWLDDKSWSLGEAVKPEYGIPADATDILLELWKYSLEIGYPFTLRHAKWVARLHNVIITAKNEVNYWKQIQTLFFIALKYADREQVSQTLKEVRFDTTHEDRDLVFSQKIPSTEATEAMTLHGFGVLPPFEISKSEDERDKEKGIRIRALATLFDMAQTGDLNVAVVVHILHTPRSVDESPDLDDDKAFDKFYGRCYEIENAVESLSVEQQRAYAILVTCFSKGPKWDDLSPKDYLKVIERFVQLVSQYNQLDQILRSITFDEEGTFDSLFKKVGLLPFKDMDVGVRLDKLLGIPEATNQKEAQND